MKTAEEFLLDVVIDNSNSFDLNDYQITSDVTKAMIEFAKLHVEAALKAKIEAMRETYTYGGYSLDELNAFTKNAYPESNIK
jgi:hypothetical protein